MTTALKSILSITMHDSSRGLRYFVKSQQDSPVREREE